MNHKLNELVTQWIASIIYDWRFTTFDFFLNINTHNYFFSLWIYLIICIRFIVLWYWKNRLFFDFANRSAIIVIIYIWYFFCCFVKFCHVSEFQSFIIVSFHCTTKKKKKNSEQIKYLSICFECIVYSSSSVVIWTASEWYNQQGKK